MNLGNTNPNVKPLLFFVILIILFIAPVLGTILQSDLKYQDRGNRYEGVKGTPVSDRVELISVMVDYNERINQMPDQFKLKFYLSQQVPVFVRVREIDNRHNYWMDKLRPSSDWHTGFSNEFQWPTQEVIKREGIQLYDLGAVAQLDSDDPSLDVRVAPVILFSSQLPRSISGYSFTFKISRKADVTCSFSKDEDNSPVLSTQSFEMPGQRPRTVNWSASNAREGWYRLKINIIYSNNGQELNQIVHFYHRPNIR
jgi:hypothetical protein